MDQKFDYKLQKSTHITY